MDRSVIHLIVSLSTQTLLAPGSNCLPHLVVAQLLAEVLGYTVGICQRNLLVMS